MDGVVVTETEGLPLMSLVQPVMALVAITVYDPIPVWLVQLMSVPVPVIVPPIGEPLKSNW